MVSTRKCFTTFFSFISLIFLLTLHSFPQQANCKTINDRETSEIITGAPPPDYNVNCPDCAQPPPESPPPPPPPPPPCPPLPPPPPECPPPPPPPPPECPPPPPPPLPPCPPPPPPPPPMDFELKVAIEAIQKFKNTIDVDPKNIIRTWTGNQLCIDKSKYTGFICDTRIKDNHPVISGINFNGFGFNNNGKNLTVRSFIESFKDLVIYHANSNFFTEDVPNQISEIISFYELDLSNNNLTGEFPQAILGATNLTFLDVRFNQLTGLIPPKVFLFDLDVLYLNNNQFVGPIPDNFGTQTAPYLALANNKLTGGIPKSIGKPPFVQLLLQNNQLSGCLPYEIGFLKTLIQFDASTNGLTGPIPHSFGCLDSIQTLNMSCNKLYGAVPENLCKLGDLQKLTLNNNYFTQVGPECRKLIEKKVLDISMNCILDLPNQNSPTKCAEFFSKRFICPSQNTMSFIPCKNKFSTSMEKSEVHHHTETHHNHRKIHSPAYTAPHKHLP